MKVIVVAAVRQDRRNMPTVLLLDCSLSMGRAPLPCAEVSYLWLVVHAMRRFLEHLRTSQPLEFVLTLLVGCSGGHPCEVLRLPAAAATPSTDGATTGSDWTRDHESLSSELQRLLEDSTSNQASTLRGRADLQLALEFAHRAVLSEWGALQTCHLLYFTDEGGRESVTQTWNASTQRWQPRLAKELPLPAPYPGLFALVALAAETLVCDYYQEAVRRAGSTRGFLLSLATTPSSCQPVDRLVKTQLCEKLFAPHMSRLRLGTITCRVQMFPAPPRELTRVRDLKMVRYELDREISVIGFLAVAHVYSPATVSRHLLLAAPGGSNAGDEEAGVGQARGAKEERMTPNLSVLLHGALRTEPMVAVVSVGRDWWGLVHSSAAGGPGAAAGGSGGGGASTSRRCALALSLLEPGSRSVAWLGGLQFLAPYSDFDTVDTAPFPLKLRDDERSFSASQPCWTRASSLTADVNKLLRLARKLPDKAHVFYKDYNRVRRYALAFGMQAVLEKVRLLLLREFQAPSMPNGSTAASVSSHRVQRDQHLSRIISHMREPHWTHELLPIGQGGIEPPPLEAVCEPAEDLSLPSDQPIDLTK